MPIREYMVDDAASVAPTWAGVALPFPPAPGGTRGCLRLPGGAGGLEVVNMGGVSSGAVTDQFSGCVTYSITGCKALLVLKANDQSSRPQSWTSYYFTHQSASGITNEILNAIYKQMGGSWLQMRYCWAILASSYSTDHQQLAPLSQMGIPKSHMVWYRARPGSGANFNFGFRCRGGQFGEV